jgi:NAD(P)-dependent dehydrogenase (short-subunit alcohol dehydrogenase family)
MYNRTACVTGADHGLGLALTRKLVETGWTVVAGRYAAGEEDLPALAAEHAGRVRIVDLDVSHLDSVRRAANEAMAEHPVIDLLINNAAILGVDGLENTISNGLDYASILATISVNALGPLRVVQEFLPAVTRSEMKRLCFISSEAGSVTRAHRPNWYGYQMSKAALNMGVSTLYTDLHPQGFSFRIYHPGWMRTFMKGQEDLRAELTPAQAAELALGYFLDDTVPEEPLLLRDEKRAEWPW